MNNTNRLISGDNKGYASLMFEKQMNPGFMPGKVIQLLFFEVKYLKAR